MLSRQFDDEDGGGGVVVGAEVSTVKLMGNTEPFHWTLMMEPRAMMQLGAGNLSASGECVGGRPEDDKLAGINCSIKRPDSFRQD